MTGISARFSCRQYSCETKKLNDCKIATGEAINFGETALRNSGNATFDALARSHETTIEIRTAQSTTSRVAPFAQIAAA